MSIKTNRNLTDNRLNNVSPLSTLKSGFKLMVFKKKNHLYASSHVISGIFTEIIDALCLLNLNLFQKIHLSPLNLNLN